MANNWYDAGRKYQLDGNLKPATDTIKACLVTSSYIVDLAAHAVLSDLGTNRIGTDQTLTSITTAAGTLKAANSLFPAVASGHQVNFLVIYKLVGDGSPSDVTSPLLLFEDTVGGFPVTTSGGDVPVLWGTGDSPANPGAIVRV